MYIYIYTYICIYWYTTHTGCNGITIYGYSPVAKWYDPSRCGMQLPEWKVPQGIALWLLTWQVKTGLASPLVKAVNGEQQCFGSDTKTEQDWVAVCRISPDGQANQESVSDVIMFVRHWKYHRSFVCFTARDKQAEKKKKNTIVGRTLFWLCIRVSSGSTPGQEWINQFASLLADPHSQVLGVCLTDGFWDAINTKKPSP